MLKIVFLVWKIYAEKGYSKRNKYSLMRKNNYIKYYSNDNILDNNLSELKFKSKIFKKWKKLSHNNK